MAAVAELRSAALIDLDDVYQLYHYTARPNAFRARIQKNCEMWITVRPNDVFGKSNRTPGRLTRPDRPLEELSLQLYCRTSPAGKSGWAWSG